LTLLLLGCSNPKRNLIVVENDYEIDLTELDSVRKNLNGFWIPENHIDAESILWLDFHKEKNSATWEIIPYTEEIKRTELLPIKSCPTFAGLMKLNGKVQMEFVSLGGSDTTEIEFLTKTKFKIDGMTYLRHKGYDFLETWNAHGNESKNDLNSNLVEFLDSPIDLLDFKKKKGMEFTTSVTSGTEYYHHQKFNDSIFYVYYYPDFKKKSIKIDQFVVFKHGENKHSYEDKTEILIEFRIFNQDSDLGKANLYGLTKAELESEFGTDYLTFKNGITYSNKNKILIIELNNSKVKSFRYIKLNTEIIDQELIRQIVE
jgi:hypothetical protein